MINDLDIITNKTLNMKSHRSTGDLIQYRQNRETELSTQFQISEEPKADKVEFLSIDRIFFDVYFCDINEIFSLKQLTAIKWEAENLRLNKDYLPQDSSDEGFTFGLLSRQSIRGPHQTDQSINESLYINVILALIYSKFKHEIDSEDKRLRRCGISSKKNYFCKTSKRQCHLFIVRISSPPSLLNNLYNHCI